jgi:diaminohydroxyphosphoribosylaminopyrimidine deaminase/5-amino-6-(5-phosphoribosylamino)uracil reductase
MNRCLEIARGGLGWVAPNPLVGAVIVHNGRIIGEGFHQQYGGPHAEVNAIQSAKNKEFLASSTLYVNLEPCSHHGKTPPCADLIIKHNIPEIVIANEDPNPLVRGKGIQKLKDHGCKIIMHVLEDEATQLNKRFITFHKKRRPYIILKWAQTLDGFIDIKRKENINPQPTWITGDALKMLVHKWRSEEMAIMVGTNTAIMDNPQLNIRYWHGQNPVRIVIDKSLRLSNSLHVFDGKQPTLVYTSRAAKNSFNLEYITIDFEKNLPLQILSSLYSKEIQSVIIEGGRELLQTFIEQDLWDEARILTGNIQFKEGISAPNCNGKMVHSEIIGDDKLIVIENKDIL